MFKRLKCLFKKQSKIKSEDRNYDFPYPDMDKITAQIGVVDRNIIFNCGCGINTGTRFHVACKMHNEEFLARADKRWQEWEKQRCSND